MIYGILYVPIVTESYYGMLGLSFLVVITIEFTIIMYVHDMMALFGLFCLIIVRIILRRNNMSEAQNQRIILILGDTHNASNNLASLDCNKCGQFYVKFWLSHGTKY